MHTRTPAHIYINSITILLRTNRDEDRTTKQKTHISLSLHNMHVTWRARGRTQPSSFDDNSSKKKKTKCPPPSDGRLKEVANVGRSPRVSRDTHAAFVFSTPLHSLSLSLSPFFDRVFELAFVRPRLVLLRSTRSANSFSLSLSF